MREMKSQGIRGDSVTYTTMINGCLNFERFETVLELMVEAKDQRINIDKT